MVGGVIDFLTRRYEFSRVGWGVLSKCYVTLKNRYWNAQKREKRKKKREKKSSENKWALRNRKGGGVKQFVTKRYMG